MPVVKQFSVVLENRPGALAEVCSELAKKAVNIQAVMVPDVRGFGPVRMVVNNAEAATRVFDAMGLRYSLEEVLAVRLSDKPGALGRVTRKLAEHDINIEYAYGSIEKGAPQALIVLAVSDLRKAAALTK
ncbi:MAG: ACT domain-containing protein [Acidobacteria bacterium]|nr:ACT domain-containing protein [Acidobacteriota bacterium]